MEWTVAIGVDTHNEVHVAVALDALGGKLDSQEIPTTAAGYGRLLSWAQELGVPAFAVEGTGSYGRRARSLPRARRRQRVRVRAPAPPGAPAGEERSRRRGSGRAQAPQRRAFEPPPRGWSARGSAPTLARASQRHAGTHRRPQPAERDPRHAPDQVRARLGGLSGERLAQAAARLRSRPAITNGVLRRLGQRVERLSKEVAETERALAALVVEVAPDLLEECGVGPVCGAQLLVSSGDPSRMTSEASFAALAGTSPVDASSGKRRRHRLNRGGDRQLNWALHVVALQRVRHHPETSAYYERLLAAGKSTREARRCVKRALARHFYRRLREMPRLPLTT